MVPLFGANTILYWFRSPKTVLNPPVKFKDFSNLLSVFQGKFNFQGRFKTNLYIQILFKTVRILLKLCGTEALCKF